MNRIATIHAQRNADTRPNWDLFEPHRRRVTEILLTLAAGEGQRLCVLGAGNSNDLDLARLAQRYAAVHLVDLDAVALSAGLASQALEPRLAERVHLHGGIDVTGVGHELSAWSPQLPPSDAELTACVERAIKAAAPDLSAPFDAVASVCLLTQLADGVVLSLGQEHARFAELMLAIRTRHVRLLAELLSPGGTGALITDVVSSASSAELTSVPDVQLGALLQRLVAERNFFHGANPFALVRLFQVDPMLLRLLHRVRLLAPWRWNLGPRVYAVCGLVFERL